MYIYKKGEKVVILNSDWPLKIPVGSVQIVEGPSIIVEGGAYISSQRFYFGAGEIKLYKEEVMNNKIEVGDTIELVNRTGYNSKLKIGDKGVVTDITDNKVYVDFEGITPTIQVGYLYQVKLVSKAKSNMKEIIGYNIKKEFKHRSKEFARLFDTDDSLTSKENTWISNDPLNSRLKELVKAYGVLDLWFEPVYKSSEVVVKLSNNRTATITSKTVATVTMGNNKAEIISGNVGYTLKMLSELGQIAGYNVGIKEFQLGCQTFTIADLVAVDKAFKDFK